jgi:hypothetical protein
MSGWSMGWLARNVKTVFKRNPDYFLPGLTEYVKN